MGPSRFSAERDRFAKPLAGSSYSPQSVAAGSGVVLKGPNPLDPFPFNPNRYAISKSLRDLGGESCDPHWFPFCPGPAGWRLDWAGLAARFGWLRAMEGVPQDSVHHAEGD